VDMWLSLKRSSRFCLVFGKDINPGASVAHRNSTKVPGTAWRSRPQMDVRSRV
jgi:hypothetical protein